MLQQINSHLVEIEILVNEPYSTILGYPRYSSEEIESRVNEVQSNGISSLLFEGNCKIGKLDLLGKGCVSIVVKAIYNDKIVALKIMRTDADRSTMKMEAEFLKLANKVGVGPTFIKNSKKFLLMSFTDGINISKFIEIENNKEKLSNVISEVLEQCYKLDRTGLDHGELSDMRRHVIVGDEITIIDFESASISRRMSNVTTAVQYFFIGGVTAKKVRNVLSINSLDSIVSSLSQYKNDINKENFERLKQFLNL